jgi:hydrogenase maturation protease
MGKILIIGFGNIYRRDDAVGFVVLNAVREKLGRRRLATDEDGYDDLGHEVDTLFLHQLVPELAELLTSYDFVIFVDAHVGVIPDPIREEWIEVHYKPGTVLHQLLPSTLLSMTREVYGRCPDGMLLSVRGHDFDFGEELSQETEPLVPQATARIMTLVRDRCRLHPTTS